MAQESANIPSNREELEYKFNAIAKKVLRANKDADGGELIEALVPDLVLAVPAAAFDPLQPFDEGILFFHGGVDEDEVSEFQHDLLRVHMNLDPKQPIIINLSSVGGSVYAGLALVSTIYQLQREGRKVNVHVQGVCMSMATVIASVADYRTMESSAFFMLHKISYGMRGSADEHEEELAFTHKLHEAMFAIYGARTGKSIDYYKKMLTKTNKYMNAQEALEEKMVDAIIEAPHYKTVQTPVKPTRTPRKKKGETPVA